MTVTIVLPPHPQPLLRFWEVAAPKVCVTSLCNLGGSGTITAGADFRG